MLDCLIMDLFSPCYALNYYSLKSLNLVVDKVCVISMLLIRNQAICDVFFFFVYLLIFSVNGTFSFFFSPTKPDHPS